MLMKRFLVTVTEADASMSGRKLPLAITVGVTVVQTPGCDHSPYVRCETDVDGLWQTGRTRDTSGSESQALTVFLVLFNN